MPEPEVSFDIPTYPNRAVDVPLPHLSGPALSDVATPRTWKAAPPGVKDAYVINIFQGCVALFVLFAFGAVYTSGRDRGSSSGLGFMLAVYGLSFGLSIVQIIGLRRGRGWTWYSQAVLSVLSLLAFPLGTLMHGIVLSKWSRPEVKAWFGVR